jgi:hypothetical protein
VESRFLKAARSAMAFDDTKLVIYYGSEPQIYRYQLNGWLTHRELVGDIASGSMLVDYISKDEARRIIESNGGEWVDPT